MEALEVGSHDERREAFAKTRHDIEGSRGTVTEQLNAVQRVVKLREKGIGLHPGAASAAWADEVVDGGPVAPGDRRPLLFVARLSAFREPGAVDQLIGDPLERRHDDDQRLFARLVENDANDVADAIGGGERRATELEDPHADVE